VYDRIGRIVRQRVGTLLRTDARGGRVCGRIAGAVLSGRGGAREGVNYLAALLDIQAGKTKDMDKRLATLHEFALVAYQKTIAVRDYLDYYEAENGGYSGKFEDFLNLPATIKKELPPRTDPISKYLDAIDKEFSK
jgi:hypothetical protein